MTKRYQVIVEGKSEETYLQSLNSFLQYEMPPDVDYGSKLLYIPHVSGGGRYSDVQRTYRQVCGGERKKPGGAFWAWVDVDLYVRRGSKDEIWNAAAYAARKFPWSFVFSFMNFEDFLALHFDDGLFDKWFDVFNAAGHFEKPLKGADYLPQFQPLWEVWFKGKEHSPDEDQYRKGDLPKDFISDESLRNMMRHCEDERVKGLMSRYTGMPPFVQFLKKNLQECYPEEFGVDRA